MKMNIGYYNLEDELDTFISLISKELRGMNIEGDEYTPRSESEFANLLLCFEENRETFEQDIDYINEIVESLEEDEKEIFLNIVEEKQNIINLFYSINQNLEILYNEKFIEEDKTFAKLSKEYVELQKKVENALDNKKITESEINDLDTDDEDYDSQEIEISSRINEIDNEISDCENNIKDQKSEYDSLVHEIETTISEMYDAIKSEISEIESNIYDLKEIKKNHFKNECFLDTKTQSLINLIDNIEKNKKIVKTNKP